ncbi:MAG: ATP-binding protein [Candidatus Anammoxibacter sp.]
MSLAKEQNMDNKIIFVGGIHGVGKTSLCAKLTNRMGVDYFSASQLIKKLKIDHCDNKNKAVKDIGNNQELLLTAIGQYVDKNSATILDGHFCLLNSNHEITQISKETFEDISPIAIIVLYDSILNISSKITNRDGVSYDINLLSSFQSEEIKYSTDIAGQLQIPYLLFDVSDDISGIVDFITNLKNGKMQ